LEKENLKSRMSLCRFAVAAIVYAGFAVYLYQPYFKDFHKLQYLLVANLCIASLGCFVLSRRWVSSFWGSFFAGAIYGFGPFLLGLGKYHPAAGFLAAGIPWLFCPAAFVCKGKWRWVSWPLSALPFLGVLLFFQLSAHCRLFPISVWTKLHLTDLAGLLAPLVMAKRSWPVLGFYHVPITALVMGFSMLLTARRLGVIAIFVIGTALAFCNSFLGISPIMWLAIPVLCCSVLVGVGTQGLVSAGSTDKRWVLAVAAVSGVLAIVTLLLATKYFSVFAGLGVSYAELFVSAGYMYILGTIAVAVIFFVARAKLRITALRLAILCSAMGVDVFFGARYVVDSLL